MRVGASHCKTTGKQRPSSNRTARRALHSRLVLPFLSASIVVAGCASAMWSPAGLAQTAVAPVEEPQLETASEDRSKDAAERAAAPKKETSPKEQETSDVVRTRGAPPIRSAPELPPDDELKALAEADPRYARRVLRRAARTAEQPRQRAFALRVLGARDPSRATARICARALRIDASAGVRRSAAECLGRMPERIGVEHTATLVDALNDNNLDVVTMAGWALAGVGSAESLSELARRVEHPDERVGRHFFTYAGRLKARHGLNYIGEGAEAPGSGVRLVPRANTILNQVPNLELAASTSWLAVYGGMTGWLHGGLFTAAYGGGGFEQLSPLVAMGGVVAGLAAGGSYGFFRADELHLAHNVVQLGTAGMLAGYGAGLLSGLPPASGVNAAGLSVLGNTVGVGLAVLMNETAPPTGGALAMGMAVGLGSALSAGAVATGYKVIPQASTGLAMLAGGTMAMVSTTLLAPYEIGLIPSVGATVGGVGGALLASASITLLENAVVGNLEGFSEGAGWGIAAGYALGAVAGASTALLIPASLDPLKVGTLQMELPTVGAVADIRNPGRPLTVAQVGGRF